MGLFYADSRTQVAIKTVNDPLDGPQRTALVCEMKILSNLELHLNLVNMMGSCISDFAVSGELWLLLEFCEHGTHQDYLKFFLPSIFFHRCIFTDKTYFYCAYIFQVT